MMLSKTTLEFDIEKLMEDLRASISGTSLRDIAAVLNVSVSTLSRIDNGHKPDMDTFIKICQWGELSPADYFIWITWTGEKEKHENGTS